MSKKLRITFEETIEKMADSLIEESEKSDVSLAPLRAKNFDVNSLDDIFHDGGEVRCERFGDLSFEYALQFGEFDSTEFNNKHWNCMVAAIKRIRTKLGYN